jgi:hypothetical protein
MSITYTLDHETAGVDTLAGDIIQEETTLNGQAQPVREFTYTKGENCRQCRSAARSRRSTFRRGPKATLPLFVVRREPGSL